MRCNLLCMICCVMYTEYFSDTNTSTYAVPDTYSASAASSGLAADAGRLNVSGGLAQQSSSFKPFGLSGASQPSLPPPPHPRDLYASEGAPECLQVSEGASVLLQ